MGKGFRTIKRMLGYGTGIKVDDNDAKLLETIHKCVELDADATEEQRKLELDDLRYCDPTTQWSESDRQSRESNGRPVLTEDRLGPFLQQVCNEQRKNKPGVQVNPVDDSGDVETAEVIQGLIRHIEYDSNADTAYDTAFESAVRCGRGFYRLCTEYVDDMTFDQEIKIKRIENHHSVFIDPSAQECDYSDAKWGGFKNWMSKEDFMECYPDSQMANIGVDSWRTIGDDSPEWMSANGAACMVVEYFWKVEKPVKRYLLESGEVVDTLPEGEKAKQTRDAIKTEVKWAKCTASEILERGEWPSKYIPIIPVLGKALNINGKRTYAGLVRAGKDPQKRHNYLLTSQVERIAFMPIATWIGAKGFMGKDKRTWANSHRDPIVSLEFEIIGEDGQGINAPKLITEEAPIRAVTEAMIGAEQGMKGVLGMYDPNMGRNESGQSGIAINRLQQQGETGNFHFQDNLSRALRYEGRIICDLIPKIYDAERVVRIIGEDGTQKTVKINGMPDEDDQREGIKRMFDLTTGKYDVTVSAGPSYQSKRQEDRALLISMLQGPMGEQIAMAVPDLVASTLDSPIAKQMAERFKKMLPPQLQEKEEGKGEEIPPELQQKMMQMEQQGQQLMQQHEQLIQALNEANDQLGDKEAQLQADLAKAQLDAETKLEIARMNNETELIKIQATMDVKVAEAQLKAQMAVFNAETQAVQETPEAKEPEEVME